eukprot:NODE_146_length_3461_cov_73.008388_g124_i0.p1 GENE.NODE_146_length_3461_cov_73.008388_g124_i0~~NODE_146_length_3461_cov_73.008388_g124_i0.p1  ORF type:complete len:1057 (+),score=220.68 NODE_146_length_3461_cov_73.008388_g124_i0:337-3171(+)
MDYSLSPLAYTESGSSWARNVSVRKPQAQGGGKIDFQLGSTDVSILLNSYNSVNRTRQPACYYWDESAQTWSRTGVTVGAITDTSVECKSSHLTPFSVAYPLPVQPSPSLSPSPSPSPSSSPSPSTSLRGVASQTSKRTVSCTWCYIIGCWAVYIFLAFVALLLDRKRESQYQTKGLPYRDESQFTNKLLSHHLLIACFFEHHRWTALQRVTVLFSSYMGFHLINALISEVADSYIWSGFVSAVAIFPCVIILGYIFHHTPSWVDYNSKALYTFNGAEKDEPVEPLEEDAQSEPEQNPEGDQEPTPPSPPKEVPKDPHNIKAFLDDTFSGPMESVTKSQKGQDYAPTLQRSNSVGSFKQVPVFTVGQLLATSIQEFRQSNYIVGLHLLMLADTRGVVGPKGNPNAGLEPVHTVRQAKERAARKLQMSLQEIESHVERDEKSFQDWQHGKVLLQNQQFRHALKAFKRALIKMNPQVELLLESSHDMRPWLVYYAREMNLDGPVFQKFLAQLDQEALEKRANLNNPNGHSELPSAPPTFKASPGYPTDSQSIARQSSQASMVTNNAMTWKQGVLEAKTKRNYIKAAYIFMTTKNNNLPPGAEKKDMEFGKQWARYYATSIKPVVTNFDEEWARQERDPNYTKFLHETPVQDQPQQPSLIMQSLSTAPQESIDNSRLPGHVPKVQQSTQAIPEPVRKPAPAPKTTPKKKEKTIPKILYVKPGEPDKKKPANGSMEAPFRTVRKALSLAKPGGEVVLLRGTYPPILAVKPAQGVILRPSEGEQVIIGSHESAKGGTIMVIGAKEFTIKGLTIEGNVGVEAVDCPGIKIVNCTFNVKKTPYVSTTEPNVPITELNTVNLPAFSVVDLLLSYPWTFLGYLLNALWLLGITLFLLLFTTDFISGRDGWEPRRHELWLASQAISVGCDWLVLQILKCWFTPPSARPSNYRPS